MKQEKYNIFFDSPMGLLSGSLDLCETGTGLSGYIMLMGHGTIITSGTMEGDRRDFEGTIWFKDEEVAFHANGELSDGVLDLDMTIGSQVYPLSCFPVS